MPEPIMNIEQAAEIAYGHLPRKEYKMPEMERYKIKLKIDQLLFDYWHLLPEPKANYTMWFYGGAKDALEKIYEDAENGKAHGGVVA